MSKTVEKKSKLSISENGLERPGPKKRLEVLKTYKIYIGGQFPRTESGRYYIATNSKGEQLANICLSSRKDFRDAVVAARNAFKGWSARAAFNRGQVLYRVAEIMEGRRAQFVELTGDEAEVDAAIDSWVWYAGWADKLAQVLGSSNPVAGPYFNFTFPEPTGVVGVVAPEEPALAGLVAHLAPVIVGGNAVVIVASQKRPLAAVTLSEVLATSDVPGGVVNVLTGKKDELAPVLAAHMDVNALDLSGAEGEREELERLAADNVKRVVANGDGQSPWHVAAFLELKTVWHPIGV